MSVSAGTKPVFPESFFHGEERDGFFVTALMKRTWAAELQMLFDLASFCEAHNLRWYADYGTLLGAVRHGGYIPWDDDIDIAMPRADYEKMLSLSGELPAPYQFLSVYHTDMFWNQHAVLKNTRAKKLEWDEERMEYFHGCPFIVDLDIFPLDNIPDDPARRTLTRLVYTIAYKLLHDCVAIEEKEAHGQPVSEEETAKFMEGVRQLQEQLTRLPGNVTLDLSYPLRNALLRCTNAIAMSCPDQEASHIAYAVQYTYDPKVFRKKTWDAETVRLPFEWMEVNAPAAYTEVLTYHFGKDYMTPRRQPAGHGYPFYAGQEEYFRFIGKMGPSDTQFHCQTL